MPKKRKKQPSGKVVVSRKALSEVNAALAVLKRTVKAAPKPRKKGRKKARRHARY